MQLAGATSAKFLGRRKQPWSTIERIESYLRVFRSCYPLHYLLILQEMQRGSYHPPPAHSPPLHHPVPQHVSTVPMMRSPPPPQGSSNYGGSPYAGQMGGAQQAQQGGGQFPPAFGGFMNDQTAQIGLQMGQKAAMAGQEYMEQSVGAQECHSYLRFTDKPESSIAMSPSEH